MRQIDLLAVVVDEYKQYRDNDKFFPLCPIDRSEAFKDIALHTDAITAIHVMDIAEAIQTIAEMRRGSDTKGVDLNVLFEHYITIADLFILHLLQDQIGWWDKFWFGRFIYHRSEEIHENRPPPEFARATNYIEHHDNRKDFQSRVRTFVEKRRKGEQEILELFAKAPPTN